MPVTIVSMHNTPMAIGPPSPPPMDALPPPHEPRRSTTPGAAVWADERRGRAAAAAHPRPQRRRGHRAGRAGAYFVLPTSHIYFSHSLLTSHVTFSLLLSYLQTAAHAALAEVGVEAMKLLRRRPCGGCSNEDGVREATRCAAITCRGGQYDEQRHGHGHGHGAQGYHEQHKAYHQKTGGDSKGSKVQAPQNGMAPKPRMPMPEPHKRRRVAAEAQRRQGRRNAVSRR